MVAVTAAAAVNLTMSADGESRKCFVTCESLLIAGLCMLFVLYHGSTSEIWDKMTLEVLSTVISYAERQRVHSRASPVPIPQ